MQQLRLRFHLEGIAAGARGERSWEEERIQVRVDSSALDAYIWHIAVKQFDP